MATKISTTFLHIILDFVLFFKGIKLATERFAEVSAKIHQSVQRHLDDNRFSSDEEDDIGDNVLNKVFQTYSNNFGTY